MLCVQVRNMGRRLLWIWFCLIADSVWVIGFGLRCGDSAMGKSRPRAKRYALIPGMLATLALWPMWVARDNVAAGTHGASLAERSGDNRFVEVRRRVKWIPSKKAASARSRSFHNGTQVTLFVLTAYFQL
jgi:type VI protein secretion system component VasK